MSLINPTVYLFNKIFVGWVIVATVPELCQKYDFLLKKRLKEIFAHLLNLRLKHFESYSIFSYCKHSSIYQVFWPSGWVIDCNILNFRHSFHLLNSRIKYFHFKGYQQTTLAGKELINWLEAQFYHKIIMTNNQFLQFWFHFNIDLQHHCPCVIWKTRPPDKSAK